MELSVFWRDPFLMPMQSSQELFFSVTPLGEKHLPLFKIEFSIFFMGDNHLHH